MKKILILSMSCNNEFFINEESIVRDTWAKPIIEGKYPNMIYASYRGEYEKNSFSKSECCFKLNVEDDIKHTFKKTYFALSLAFKSFGEFDYVFKTNTSTYVNIELLNEFVQSLDNDNITYCGEIYSLSEMPCPYPMCLLPRGNSILIPNKMVNVILNDGLKLLYSSESTDDTFISNILNSYWISNREDYREHVKTFYHGWYKCTTTTVENNHPLCKYNESRTDFGFWKDFVTVQMKKYSQDRSLEKETYYEFDKIIKNGKYDNIQESVRKNIEYSKKPPVFIGSILGYMEYDKWVDIDKTRLYYIEETNKASDDPRKYEKKEPFIYVDWHGNTTNKMLI